MFNTAVYSTDSWGVKEKIPKYYVKVYRCKSVALRKNTNQIKGEQDYGSINKF